MLALKIIAAIVVVCILMGQLRIGALVSFGEELRVTAHFGPVKLQIIPPSPKKEKEPKKEKPKPDEAASPEKKKPKLDLTFDEMRSGLRAIWQALQRGLRQTGRRVRIDPMSLSIIVGSSDPAQTAKLYGWLSSAVWAVMPRLETLTQLPHPYIHTGMDFTADEMKVSGTVGIRFRIHDGIVIGLAFARPLLRWLLPLLKTRKAAAQQETKQNYDCIRRGIPWKTTKRKTI